MMTKSNKTTSTFARVALGATAVLALASRAHATACTGGVNEYSVGTDGKASNCRPCPVGTEKAVSSDDTAISFCEKISANYYGTVGVAASSHAVVSPCPFGGTATASTTTTTIAACTTNCGGGGTVAVVSNSCVCAANHYGTPVDANGDTVGAYSTGCTACPFAGTSTQGSTVLGSCTPNCGAVGSTFATATGGSCGCVANYYGEPKDTNSAKILLAVAGGCTKCPFAGTAAAGAGADNVATTVTSCTPDCATTNPTSLAEATGGTCQCSANSYGAPKDSTRTGTATAAATGCTSCAAKFPLAVAGSLESAAGQTTVAGCTVVKGYYVKVGGTDRAVTALIPDGYYRTTFTANIAISGSADDTIQTCPVGSSTPYGADTADDCYISDGYVTDGSGTVGSTLGAISQVAANKYFARTAPKQVTSALADVVSLCPYAGTSPAGSSSLSACTPDCNTKYASSGAIAQSGTCVCAAGTWGTPYDALTGSSTAAAARAGCKSCSVGYPLTVAGSLTSVPGATGNDDCVVAPGYTISHDGNNQKTTIKTAKAPANTYAEGMSLIENGQTQYTLCPAHSTAAAGSSSISDCKCVAGYVSTANACSVCAGRAAGDSVGTVNACAATTTPAATPGAPGAPAASGASSVSVFAAVATIAAAQLVL